MRTHPIKMWDNIDYPTTQEEEPIKVLLKKQSNGKYLTPNERLRVERYAYITRLQNRKKRK
jgi:hypothetical protein